MFMRGFAALLLLLGLAAAVSAAGAAASVVSGRGGLYGSPVLLRVVDGEGNLYAIAGIVDIVFSAPELLYVNDTYAATSKGVTWIYDPASAMLTVCSEGDNIVFSAKPVGDVVVAGANEKLYLFGPRVLVLEASAGVFSSWGELGLKYACANITVAAEYEYDDFVAKLFPSDEENIDVDKLFAALVAVTGDYGEYAKRLVHGLVNTSASPYDPAITAVLAASAVGADVTGDYNYSALPRGVRVVFDALHGYDTIDFRPRPGEFGYIALAYAVLGDADRALRYGLADVVLHGPQPQGILALALADKDYARRIAWTLKDTNPRLALLALLPLVGHGGSGGGLGETPGTKASAKLYADALAPIITYASAALLTSLLIISLFIRLRPRTVVAAVVVLALVLPVLSAPAAAAETTVYGELTVRVDVYFPAQSSFRSTNIPVNYTVTVDGYTTSPVKLIFYVPHVSEFELLESYPHISMYRYFEASEVPGYMIILPGHSRIHVVVGAALFIPSTFYRNILNGFLLLRGRVDGDIKLREVYVYHFPQNYIYEYYIDSYRNMVGINASAGELVVVYEQAGRNPYLHVPPSTIYYDSRLSYALTTLFAAAATAAAYRVYRRRRKAGAGAGAPGAPDFFTRLGWGLAWFTGVLRTRLPPWRTLFALTLILFGAWYVVTVSLLSPVNAPVVATAPLDQDLARKLSSEYVVFTSSLNLHRIGDYPFANHIIVPLLPKDVLATPFRPSSALLPNLYYFLQHGGFIYVPEKPPTGTLAEYIKRNMEFGNVVTYTGEPPVYGFPDYTLLTIAGFLWTLGLVLVYLTFAKSFLEDRHVALKAAATVLATAVIATAGQTASWVVFAAHFRYSVLNYTVFWFAGRALFRFTGFLLAGIALVLAAPGYPEGGAGRGAAGSWPTIDPYVVLAVVSAALALLFSPTPIGTDLSNAVSALLGGDVSNLRVGTTGVVDTFYSGLTVAVYKALGMPTMGAQTYFSRGGAFFLVSIALLYGITRGLIRSPQLKYGIAFLLPLFMARSAMRLYEMGWFSLVPTLAVSAIVSVVVLGAVVVADRLILIYGRGG